MSANDVKAVARRMYSEYSGNHPTIHCNRFRTWDELGKAGQREWLAKAKTAIADYAEMKEAEADGYDRIAGTLNDPRTTP